MSGLYTQRRHEQALGELKAEYDGRLKELQAALAELKEENRSLSAEISLLTAQKQSISEAMIAAGEKREEMQAQLAIFIQSEKAIAMQAAEKAQALLEDVRAAYPDEAASKRFSDFERRLKTLLSPLPQGDSEENEAENSLPEEEFVPCEIHSGLAFSASEMSEKAGEGWELKEVLETLGLSDD